MRYFCREHPNGPVCVDVEWLLASVYCFYSSLNTTKSSNGDITVPLPPFPPEPRPPRQIPNIREGSVRCSDYTTNDAVSAAAITTGERKKNNNNPRWMGQQRQKPTVAGSPSSLIFRGDVFVIMPSPKKDDDGAQQVVHFGYEEMESTIINHGGSLLRDSNTKNDVKMTAEKKENRIEIAVTPSSDNPDNNFHDRRKKYYVVSNVMTDYLPNKHLAELSNLGIDTIPVSSVWVAACVRNGCKYNPVEYPLLFQPQTWLIRLFHSPADPTTSLAENGRRKAKGVLVSVTGFVDSSRYGIISMLHEIGTGYTDNLSRKNTHLICKDRSGPKYVKALEWGLHVVSIDWLYHIVRHGYENGSEDRFSFVVEARKEPVDEMTQKQLPLKGNTLSIALLANKEDGKGELSSLNDHDDCGKEEVENMANQLVEKCVKTQGLQPFEVNGRTGKSRGVAENESKRAANEKHSLWRLQSQTQASSPLPPNDRDDSSGHYSSRYDGALQCGTTSNKRLLTTNCLEPIAKLNTNIIDYQSGKGDFSIPNAHGERGTSSQPSLLTLPIQKQSIVQDENEVLAMSPVETETQFTTGTILANAEIGDISLKMSLNNKKNRGGFSFDEIPPSQAYDAEGNGESQVVWFAAARG